MTSQRAKARSEKMQRHSEMMAILSASWPFVSIPSVLLVNSEISDGAKLTYAFLHMWGQRDGRAYPNREVLAEARGVARSVLHDHLSELERHGWIGRAAEGRRTVIKVMWWHERQRVTPAVNRSGVPDQSALPDPLVRPAGHDHPITPVCDEEEERREKKSEASSSVNGELTARLSALLLLRLNEFEEGFARGLLVQIGSGKGPTKDQLSKLAEIEAQTAHRKRKEAPANVPTREQQASRLRAEIEHMEQVLAERTSEGAAPEALRPLEQRLATLRAQVR